VSFVLGATWLALSISVHDHAAVLCLALVTTIGPRMGAQRSTVIRTRLDGPPVRMPLDA
jgi:hypothetical protein